jgi:hypothetical protein
MNDNTPKKSSFDTQAPLLNAQERKVVWEHVRTQIPQTTFVVSPFSKYYTFAQRKTVLAMVLLLLIGIGGGGTAVASEASRPGDLLFGVERGLEDVRLRLARSQAVREQLSEQFTQERLEELRAIVNEEIVVSSVSSDMQLFSGLGPIDTNKLSIEVDVFEDVTVIAGEINDIPFYFETNAKTEIAVIAVILKQFPMLSESQVVEKLDFEIEDRASRQTDRGVVTFSPYGQKRVDTALSEILDFITKHQSDDNQDQILRSVINEIPVATRIRFDDEQFKVESEDAKIEIDNRGRSRLEFTDGSNRVRIEERDGDIRIRTEEISTEDDDDDDKEDSSGSGSDDRRDDDDDKEDSSGSGSDDDRNTDDDDREDREDDDDKEDSSGSGSGDDRNTDDDDNN